MLSLWIIKRTRPALCISSFVLFQQTEGSMQMILAYWPILMHLRSFYISIVACIRITLHIGAFGIYPA